MDASAHGDNGPRYTGYVKKLLPATASRPAHGFIDCEETRAQYGRDVFLHDKLATRLHVGQAASFCVIMNTQGMPQAVDVVLEDGADAMGGETASAPSHAGRKGGVQAQWSLPTGQQLFEILMPEVAPAIQSGAGQAVAAALIAAADLLGVSNDMRLQLAATMPQDQARSVAASAWGSWGAYDGWGGKGDVKGWDSWDSKGFSYGKKGAGKQNHRPAPYGTMAVDDSGGLRGSVSESVGLGAGRGGDPQSGGPYQGRVKSITVADVAKGGHPYGFIDCEETRQIYGRDVFLHSQQAAELEVGAHVRFEVMLNGRGMPQAHNVVLFE